MVEETSKEDQTTDLDQDLQVGSTTGTTEEEEEEEATTMTDKDPDPTTEASPQEAASTNSVEMIEDLPEENRITTRTSKVVWAEEDE
jgi:hypothetical protein